MPIVHFLSRCIAWLGKWFYLSACMVMLGGCVDLPKSLDLHYEPTPMVFARLTRVPVPVPTTPFLRIEAGMHTGLIQGIATDAAGRYAVTASFDKTARVWDVETGKLLQVLRPPIAPGHEGRLYAVAISPDGETVALAGWTGMDWAKDSIIYLFDRASGRMLRRLSADIPDVIFQLAISPDGNRLAAALAIGSGVRVWDLRSDTPALADSQYGANSYGVAWSADGKLVTSSYDGKIRLYRPTGTDINKVAEVLQSPGGAQPHGVAFSPDGHSIVVGHSNRPVVDVLDGDTLAFRFRPSMARADSTFKGLYNVA